MMLGRPGGIAQPETVRADSGAQRLPVIVLANRAPVGHTVDDEGQPVPCRSASGLVTAIEPLVARAAGTWVAHGGEADLAAADARGHLHVSGDTGQYRVRYVSLDERTYDRFYGGFANEALWPLCHAARVAPAFRSTDFAAYTAANRRYARAVVETARKQPSLVLVQDYHFALAPQLIRKQARESRISSFWHIPWPHARVFRACPWAAKLLTGLLGSDVVGVQTDEDVEHFLDAVTLLTRFDVDTRHGTIDLGSRRVHVRPYPVGIDWSGATAAKVANSAICRQATLAELGRPEDTLLVVGVDRMDYTKGLVEKLAALELLLERRSDLRERLVLLQVAEPSRASLEAYRKVGTDVRNACARINARFGAGGRAPIHLLDRHCDAAEVYRYYRAADACWVNSLDDGMNLVAKEFVAARSDERGVLLLSEFAGASRQLSDALLVNPFATQRTARALERALETPAGEQISRMRSLRRIVSDSDAVWWASRLLGDLADTMDGHAEPEIDDDGRTRLLSRPGPGATI